MIYNLLIDNFIDLKEVYASTQDEIYLDSNWISANYNQFIDVIKSIGIPQIISFGNEKALNDIYIRWIEDFCNKNQNNIPKYIIHN